MSDDKVRPFTAIQGKGYNANNREIFYCTGCASRSFKLVKFSEDDTRVQCANCEDWMMGLTVQRTEETEQ